MPISPGEDDYVIADTDGTPVVHRVRYAHFQLESLVPADGALLDRANRSILDWFGDRLRWCLPPSTSQPEPFEPSHLDYVSCFAEDLAVPAQVRAQAPELRVAAQVLQSFSHDELVIFAHGGQVSNYASPFSYRFYCVVPEVAVATNVHPSKSFLSFTVPLSWSEAEFAERVRDLLSYLPVRWAAAGYGYSGWEIDGAHEVSEAIMRHSRRRVGYDVGFYDGCMDVWHHAIRSVNWMTAIGPAFQQKLADAGVIASSSGDISVETVGDNLLITAGKSAQEGDINRLQVPSAYIHVDAMLRALRPTDTVDFGFPWSEKSTDNWLRRFEKRLS